MLNFFFQSLKKYDLLGGVGMTFVHWQQRKFCLCVCLDSSLSTNMVEHETPLREQSIHNTFLMLLQIT